MKHNIFLVLLVVASLSIFVGCQVNNIEPAIDTKGPAVSFANPAAVYCGSLGYVYETQETDIGQIGVCHFDDETTCDAWDFLSGKCGQEKSICAQKGLNVETRSDGEDSLVPEYAVCVTDSGEVFETVTVLSNLEQKSTEGCGAREPETPPESNKTESTETIEPIASLPASFDWRSQPKGNYMTNVRDQGQCGSCWAFSAVGVMEAAWNISRNTVGNNYDFSEQYLVSDCHSVYGYQNCCGGWKDDALEYIMASGIPDEACMPYVDGNYSTGCSCNGEACGTNCTYRTNAACSDRTCSNRCSNWSTRLKKISTTGYAGDSRDAIKTALVSKGPLAVSLRMNGSFSNGIYRCSPDSPTNHAVVIVGYNDAGGYWIARNSWGASWNGNGYFNVGYGECSIENYVYSATVDPLHKDSAGVFRPSNGALYLKNSNTTGFADVAINYGIAGDYPVVGDWNGNGIDTIGVYRNGVFYLRNSNTIGFADISVPFGAPGDQPIAGDWNGDGVDTIGVYRNSTGTFFLRNNNTAGPAQMVFSLGIPGDIAITGDWNGDGIDTVGVFRPGNGAIYLKK